MEGALKSCTITLALVLLTVTSRAKETMREGIASCRGSPGHREESVRLEHRVGSWGRQEGTESSAV